jgi:hypothetical protein
LVSSDSAVSLAQQPLSATYPESERFINSTSSLALYKLASEAVLASQVLARINNQVAFQLVNAE